MGAHERATPQDVESANILQGRIAGYTADPNCPLVHRLPDPGSHQGRSKVSGVIPKVDVLFVLGVKSMSQG